MGRLYRLTAPSPLNHWRDPWMTPTVVFDTYWRFAAERLAMFYRRYSNPSGPWTSDPILRTYRFTNSYRAADRVSQYLIGEVQAGVDRPNMPQEVFFRTMLFKIFNRIDTWEALEEAAWTAGMASNGSRGAGSHSRGSATARSEDLFCGLHHAVAGFRSSAKAQQSHRAAWPDDG